MGLEEAISLAKHGGKEEGWWPRGVRKVVGGRCVCRGGREREGGREEGKEWRDCGESRECKLESLKEEERKGGE